MGITRTCVHTVTVITHTDTCYMHEMPENKLNLSEEFAIISIIYTLVIQSNLKNMHLFQSVLSIKFHVHRIAAVYFLT